MTTHEALRRLRPPLPYRPSPARPGERPRPTTTREHEVFLLMLRVNR